MKRLVESRATDVSCIKCDTLLTSRTPRWVDGSMHYCAVCPEPAEIKQTAEGILFYRLLSNKK